MMEFAQPSGQYNLCLLEIFVDANIKVFYMCHRGDNLIVSAILDI